MVYRLTCPACRGVQESQFVRLGAVSPCPSCGKAFRVEAGMIVKLSPAHGTPPPAAEAVEAQAPVVAGESKAKPPSGNGAEAIVGLSGLSEKMRQEAGDSGQRPALEAPPAARPAIGPSPVGSGAPPSHQEQAQQRALDAARRRRRRLLLGLLVAMTLIMGLIGVMIAMLGARPEGSTRAGSDRALEAVVEDDVEGPFVVARGIEPGHPAFFARTRYDVRATATPRAQASGEVATLDVRLVATEADPPPAPFDLLLTASDAQNNLGAWVFRVDQAIERDQSVTRVVRLEPALPSGGGQWILTAFQSSGPVDP